MTSKTKRYFIAVAVVFALLAGFIMFSSDDDVTADNLTMYRNHLVALEHFLETSQQYARNNAVGEFTGSIWSTPLEPGGFIGYEDVFLIEVTSSELTTSEELRSNLSAATGIPINLISFIWIDPDSFEGPQERLMTDVIKTDPLGAYQTLNGLAEYFRSIEDWESLKVVEEHLNLIYESGVIERERDDSSHNIDFEPTSSRIISMGASIFASRVNGDGSLTRVQLTAGHPADSRGRGFFTASHGSTRRDDVVTLANGQAIGAITTNPRFEPRNGIDVSYVELLPDVTMSAHIASTFETLTNFRGGSLPFGSNVHTIGAVSRFMTGTAFLAINPITIQGMNLNQMTLVDFGARGGGGDSGAVLWHNGIAYGTLSFRSVALVDGFARDFIAFSRAINYN
ncbi:MAG: hypothetical protein FWE33_00125 [Defluviitaleaceae bacterium]|nr:hypothetical protein [Defluviitaleaceae bacterium]